jgi:uncharacterized membrane protein
VYTAVVMRIAVIIQSIVIVYIKLLQLVSDEIGSRLHIVGLPLMLMIKLSFPSNYNRLNVGLKSFYEALFCVYECLNITYSCTLLWRTFSCHQ